MDNLNIIAIREQDIHSADLAFANFMMQTETYLNEKTTRNHQLYKTCNGTDLEKVAIDVLKEIAPSTPFRPENIELVSGARFPDIVAEHYYGVEVKSTKEDNWKSTGSSIVESTRIEDISQIYMLFGKLGGEMAQFKCKPYEDCLYNIAVTHSPRYLIDMDLDAHKEKNIFDKINVPYNEFRLFEESKKIKKVRQYYKQKAKNEGKLEMPWWMGEEGTSVNISFYNDLNRSRKNKINVRMFILFPCIFKSDFKPAALWLCNRYSLLCPNMRDFFTAGGKVSSLNGNRLRHSVPQIISRLFNFRNEIEALLKNPDSSLIQDISDYWPIECSSTSYYETWRNLVNEKFKEIKELSDLTIEEIFNY